MDNDPVQATEAETEVPTVEDLQPVKERVSKRLIIWSAVAGLVVVVVIYVLFCIPQKIEAPAVSVPPQSSPLTEITEEDMDPELLAAAEDLIAAGNIERCEELEDEYRNICVNNIALEQAVQNKDVSFCTKMDGVMVSREYCEQQVVATLYAEGDPEYCLAISSQEEQNACLNVQAYAEAYKNGDVSFCEKSESVESVAACKDVFAMREVRDIASLKAFSCAVLEDSATKEECLKIQRVLNEVGDEFNLSEENIEKLSGVCDAAKTGPLQNFCSAQLPTVNNNNGLDI